MDISHGNGIRDLPWLGFAATVILGLFVLVCLKRFIVNQKRKVPASEHPPVPQIPGLPLIGNLLQLREKKPYKTFAKWAETYGPIYSIKTGASTLVVLNSTQVAKEAMVTRYPSISTRKLSKALKILTCDKCMVATSDYNEFHKMVKRYIVKSLLGANAQKQYLGHRNTMIENILNYLHDHVKNHLLQAVNFREVFKNELFGLALKQALGKDLDSSIYVEELGIRLSREEVFQVLVVAPLTGAIEVDWRDFFPYLRWIPNKKLEMKIWNMDFRRQAVMKALIQQHKERTAKEGETYCYFNFLLSEAKTLTEKQIAILTWEAIIETSDTTSVTTEWAMYELAKDMTRQHRLYQEIQNVCGFNKVKEENLSQLPYLCAVFHETLRKYSPAPLLPLRYVHEDTQVGGYCIPAGSEIAINIYGCNMDKNQWDEPEEWKPERFLATEYDPMDLHKTMAFGAGKRACAGSQQAMAISCMAIGRSIQEFEWRLEEGEEGNVDMGGFTTHKLYPMQAIIKPRN